MASPLLQGGLELMAFGMGTVFVFLTLLVLVTASMSWLLQRFAPEPHPTKDAPELVSGAPSPHMLAVITAAIHQHRRIRGGSRKS